MDKISVFDSVKTERIGILEIPKPCQIGSGHDGVFRRTRVK
jgi:hypothetical protein